MVEELVEIHKNKNIMHSKITVFKSHKISRVHSLKLKGGGLDKSKIKVPKHK